MGKNKTKWACKECGQIHVRWVGSCTACHKWNTLEEEVLCEVVERFVIDGQERTKPLRVSEVQAMPCRRLVTEMKELDKLLGGGITVGSLHLLAGDPGIGKSTLLLQISEALAKQGHLVLYVTGEESVEQTALRARRLGIHSEHLYIFSETNFLVIKAEIERLRPAVLIIDSIQILYKTEIASAPGSVSQVKELAMEFMHLSKRLGIATFLIGHVTKTGEIAGPRVLEHIVDVVLDFEGDRHVGYRILRGVKNRFGPTDDIVLFQMGSHGLMEVDNQSQFFLQERKKEATGSVVIH